MVSVHPSDDVGAPAIPLPGNDCGCAQNGPLLLTIDDETPGPVYLRSKVYLRSNAGGASSVIGLAVEHHSVPELEMEMKDTASLADEVSDDKGNGDDGMMAGGDDDASAAAGFLNLSNAAALVASIVFTVLISSS